MTHMPFPQMFRYERLEISISSVENPGGESQQSPSLQMPRIRLLLYDVSLRGQTVLLHGALQEEHLLVFQERRPGQLQMIYDQIRHVVSTRNCGYIVTLAFAYSVLVVETFC